MILKLLLKRFLTEVLIGAVGGLKLGPCPFGRSFAWASSFRNGKAIGG